MSAFTPTPPLPASNPALPTDYIFPLTVAQYHGMIASGILGEDDPVELLEGLLVYKMPKNPSHRVALTLLHKALADVVPKLWHIQSQDLLTFADSEPEPDLAIVRGDAHAYTERHPRGDEASLVVEIADSSLLRDRGTKQRLYAANGVSCYWIVNLVERQIEVFTHPSGAVYGELAVFRPGENLPFILDGQEWASIPVSDLLP